MILNKLSIATIRTDINNNNEPQHGLLLTIPKTLRNPPRKRIFQEDELSTFLGRDTIENFASLSEKDCLPGFTYVQQEASVLMYRLVIEPNSNIPAVKESISIDSNLHVSLSYCGFHVPLPSWFRSVHGCKLSRRSMLENFPPYIKSKGKEMNPILQEINKMQHYKAKGRPQYSTEMIRYVCMTQKISLVFQY